VREIFQRERERISGEKRDSGEEKRERERGGRVSFEFFFLILLRFVQFTVAEREG